MKSKRSLGYSYDPYDPFDDRQHWPHRNVLFPMQSITSSSNHVEDTSNEVPDDLDFGDTMKTIGGVIVGIVLVVLLIWLIRKCCCQGSRGQVITLPPPAPDVNVAVYPQQQYAPAHNVVTTYPVSQPAPQFGVQVMPQHGAPYPPAGFPYPTAGAPYPPAGAPYPTAGPPHPTAGAPYHTVHSYVAPYAMPTPVLVAPEAAPNAPDAHAMPPSYEQAVSAEKSTPYNPHYPH